MFAALRCSCLLNGIGAGQSEARAEVKPPWLQFKGSTNSGVLVGIGGFLMKAQHSTIYFRDSKFYAHPKNLTINP